MPDVRLVEDLLIDFLGHGPGWLMSLAYLDPGNSSRPPDSRHAADLGAALVDGDGPRGSCWPRGSASARGSTSRSSAGYSRRTSLALWVLTEVAIIGSDIQEIVHGDRVPDPLRLPVGLGAADRPGHLHSSACTTWDPQAEASCARSSSR